MLAEQKELNQMLCKAKAHINDKEFEKAEIVIKQLRIVMEKLLNHSSFDQKLFLHPSEDNKNLRELLIELDNFFTNEIKNLTHISQQVVSEISSLKTANKMKKAYGA